MILRLRWWHESQLGTDGTALDGGVREVKRALDAVGVNMPSPELIVRQPDRIDPESPGVNPTATIPATLRRTSVDLLRAKATSGGCEMGLFGNDDEQDARLDEIEKRMRRMAEHVSQLSADLSLTRMELLKTRIAVDKTVKAGDLDPVFGQLNEALISARQQLEASKAAADESWAMLQDGSDEALEALRTGIEGAWTRLDEERS